MELSHNQIHIWKLHLNNEEIDLHHLYEEVLSPDERSRVDRLRSEVDKKRSISSRGLLRKRLGAYLKIDPCEITFSYNKYGKPSLDPSSHNQDLKFNISHSRDIVLHAITQSREIGIDVEYLKVIDKADKIVGRFFSEEEKNFYNSQPEDKKKWAFFTLWTRKEAYSKAMGRGIGLPSKDFDLNLIPNYEDSKLEDPAESKKSKWTLYNLEIHEEYLAALATEGNEIEIKHCDLGSTF